MLMERVALGTVLDIQNGFAFKSELFCEKERGLPLIRIRDIHNNDTEINYDGPFREEFIVQPGDFVIGMDGDFECQRWSGPTALLNQRVCRLKNFSGRLLGDYVYYLIGRHLQRIHSTTSFVTVKHISSKQIANIEIELPPLAEQRRIVDMLDRAASIRRLRRQAQETARQIVPALFNKMFGDPMTNPMGWPVAPLETAANVASGVTKGRRLDGADVVDVPYMRVANVQDGFLDLGEIKTIQLRPSEVDRFRLLPGDMLMTEGGDPDKLGRGAIWTGQIPYCAHQNHVFRVRADRTRILPHFLACLSGSAYGKGYFLRVAKRTTGIASINKTQLSAFPVLMPPIFLQEEFERRIDDFTRLTERQTAAETVVDCTVQALQAHMFR